MEVVWHYDVVIQFDGGSHNGSALPFSDHNLAKFIWMHDAAGDVAEGAFVFMCAYRDEVCAVLGVIVVLQANGTAVVSVRIVVQNQFLSRQLQVNSRRGSVSEPTSALL